MPHPSHATPIPPLSVSPALSLSARLGRTGFDKREGSEPDDNSVAGTNSGYNLVKTAPVVYSVNIIVAATDVTVQAGQSLQTVCGDSIAVASKLGGDYRILSIIVTAVGESGVQWPVTLPNLAVVTFPDSWCDGPIPAGVPPTPPLRQTFVRDHREDREPSSDKWTAARLDLVRTDASGHPEAVLIPAQGQFMYLPEDRVRTPAAVGRRQRRGFGWGGVHPLLNATPGLRGWCR